MKNLSSLILLIFLSSGPLSAQNSDRAKLSPFTKMYLLQWEKAGKEGVILPGYVYKTIANKPYLSAVVKVADNVNESIFTAMGVLVGTKAGNIWTMQIPADQVALFVASPGMEYIQLDEPMAYALDSARVATHVDSVHAGINLPMPFSGKDVLVGIIDAGFDLHHPTFFDTTGTKFRVRRVWAQKTAGTPPAGYAYGNELTDSTAMWAAGTDNSTFSHGSHVAGIAGGSGFGGDTSNRRFRGMAYQSDLAFVGIMPDASEWINTGVSDVIDGMNYLYTYANSIGKPCVVNLSWGTTVGPHDGTSLFSQACDNLTGAGKIFVLAAGNNGGQKLHVKKTFTASDTLVSTRVGFDPALNAYKTWVDIWGDPGQNFCIKFTIYSGLSAYANTGYICLDDNIHSVYLVGPNHDTSFLTITTSTSEFNQKTRAFIDVRSQSSSILVVSVAATAGTVNMWEGYVQNGHGYYGQFSNLINLAGGVQGDANYTVGDIADTKSAITVAAYASKNIYTGLNNATTDYTTYASIGAIAPFSSTGPTIDGRTKPDIAAPGLILGSAVNSYDTTYGPTGPYYSDAVSAYHNPQNNRDYRYGMMMGTSMAAPSACGIIALLLEANPQLTPTQVRAILYANAIQDAHTGVIPAGGSTVWGGGKINAYRSVIDAINHTTGALNVTNDKLNCMLFPNPNKGTFSIGYYGEESEILNIQVLDITGRLVMSDSWAVGSGYNAKLFAPAGIAKGLYFTKVSGSTGSTVFKTLVQ